MNPHKSVLWLRLLGWIVRAALSLRYRVCVHGLDEVRARGANGILFLPNHPALVDPVIIAALLYSDFAPRSVADEVQIDRPVIGWLARKVGARVLPNLDRRGASGVDRMRAAITETIEGLRTGENLMIWPAGHLKHRREEEIGGASALHDILKAVPNLRVVVVRQNGLWGSCFSFGYSGSMPRVGPALWRGLLLLLVNAIFLMPRRPVDLEFLEPADFPRSADRLTLNRYLENLYNAKLSPNTYVPYVFWKRGGPRALPDPETPAVAGDPASIPPGTRHIVVDHLVSLTGRSQIALSDRLGADLGLDSLAAAELVLWIEQEFGVQVGTPEGLKTVGDVVLAAGGKGRRAPVALNPVGARWFAPRSERRVTSLPKADHVVEAFLQQAAAGPGRIAVADQTSGDLTYRQIITAVMVLKPLIEALPEPHVGLMFPASAGAVIFYLAALAAGKTPVMVNWTTGSRNLVHSLDLLGVRRVITARALVARLNSLGTDLSALENRFVLVEDLRARVTLPMKLRALVRSYTSWRSLTAVTPPRFAVVLFTSGSESLPKAVPLTHGNILTNVRDVPQVVYIRDDDALVGMLPPFHSFGIIITMILPLIAGIRAVYHPNPTESATLARLLEAYKVTMLVGTPTFLSGILRVASGGQLESLRLAVTGAEKCPDALFDALEKKTPQLTVIEGYGITECSPIVSANRSDRQKRGSIGWLLPDVSGAIVNLEAGHRVRPGETGMLLVRGPSIFEGYLNYHGESPFVPFEGETWYRTGDLVRQDEDGALYFEGRLKRFIKLGGEMISLPAIEAVLVSAFGSETDEGPVLAVEALEDHDDAEIVVFTRRPLTREQVNEQIRRQGLSGLYNVRRVIPVEEIPVLGTGKTDYRQLKERHSRG